MADGQDTTITVPAATAAPASDAVITENPTPAPAAETVATSTIQEIAPAATVEPVKAETKVEPKAEAKSDAKAETPTPPVTESILGDEKPDTKAKADAKPKEAETKVEAPKVELPTYEAFTLPENVTLDKEPLDVFSKILGEIEVGKLDHAGMQAAGQKLIDLAAKNTVDSINRLNDYYVGIHEKQKSDWFENFKKDPEMGGEKLRDSIELLRGSVEQYAGTPEQTQEFRALMKDTGVANHPAVCRLLYNMQKKIDSYTKETNNRSVPAQAPAPSKVKPYQRFYTGAN